MAVKKKVLHQHLIKCGGTALNAFLDNQFYANRVHDSASATPIFKAAKPQYLDKYGNLKWSHQNGLRWRLNHYDCIHSHNPHLWAADAEFCTVTVMRDPVSRVISQIRDWQRLKERDLNGLNQENDNFRKFCWEADVESIFEARERSPMSRNHLSNSQTKLLAKSINRGRDPASETELLKLAKEAIDRVTVVGLVENMQALYSELCREMMWCPPAAPPILNRTSSEKVIPSSTINEIERANILDRELYEYAKDKLAKFEVQNFDLNEFEELFASNSVKRVAPIYVSDSSLLFDFNMPIIGQGYFGRDGANSPECAIWTSKETTLYYPIFPLLKFKLKIHVAGVSGSNVLSSLKIAVDEESKSFSVQNASGDSFTVVSEHISERDFLKIKISSKTNSSTNDKRKRGLCIKSIEYSL